MPIRLSKKKVQNGPQGNQVQSSFQPTDLSVKLIVNWLQTTRESGQVDETYKETLAKIMSGKVNPYLKSMVSQRDP